ncbi:MAG: efflux RND transporter permease subunit [Ferruginibacter sp.]
MSLSEFSLRRPVFAVVLNVAIVLFGLIGYKFLGVRDYPALDPPNISVRTPTLVPMRRSLKHR